MTYFSVIAGHLYNMGADELLQIYVPYFERDIILAEAHGGDVRGHYAGKMTMQKILHVGLWWPTVHKDSKVYYKECNTCQRINRPS